MPTPAKESFNRDTVFLICRVPKDLKEAARKVAETEFTTLSAVVRQGIASRVREKQACSV